MILSLNKQIQLELICPDINLLLKKFSVSEVNLKNVALINDITVLITISNNDHKIVNTICNKYGAKVRICNKIGFLWQAEKLLYRPVIMLFLLIVIALSIYLPGKIFFITVAGNEDIPSEQIVEAAEDCGIVFGASRRSVRSEKIKNALLRKIPELQWAGINTFGCTAVISVQEKTKQDKTDNDTSRVCSIVASRDGIIQSCTVYQGNQLCSVGQVVKEGQVLVSGYTDCGIVTKAAQASGEIKALTFREIQVISPCKTVARANMIKKTERYAIRIGKKLIKFYKDGGNLDASCAKIYEEKFWTLPSGFQLPVSILIETTTYYYTAPDMPEDNASKWLDTYVENYLRDVMIAGEIISRETDVSTLKNCTFLHGRYACIEHIGKIKYEQMMIEGD